MRYAKSIIAKEKLRVKTLHAIKCGHPFADLAEPGLDIEWRGGP
jgi:hypothetical protein